ncbi:hypothetical protein NBRC116592_08310 [Colwellia sp. KU-HH00111]|uniref:DUF1456 family protein n=1 Tax=Colwellia sp. KU-HH00111 TaxID=3127652 RepID=UPI003106D25D
MNNNDVLRRLRYTFNFNDNKMIALFASVGKTVTREQVSGWLKKDNDDDFVNCQDIELAAFLNGFINEKRGKKAGPSPVPEKRLTNNIVLTKLKIALNLKAEELIDLLKTVDFRLNKPELSAFSRKPDHKHYRECKDQVLRNLLQAIDLRYHVARTGKIVKNDANAQEAGASNKHNHSAKTQKSQHKAKSKAVEQWIEGARPNASAVYVNPKSEQAQSKKSSRQVLKLGDK